MQPLAIELFAGLHGWGEGLVAENYFCVGFDVVDMCRKVGQPRPKDCELVLQDVLTLHGSQFKDAALIVASPPCQEYSYMAMPWSRAKAIAAEYRSGTRDVKKLTALFDACFRIQAEAIEAAGHHIPLVVENVRGACPWVGRSRWNFGSFHLWGDVPALMPMTQRVQKFNPDGTAHPPGSWFAIADSENRGAKRPGHDWNRFKETGETRMNGQDSYHGHKNNGGSWFNIAHNTTSGKGMNPDGRLNNSARKAASAQIARIPFPLAQHIARVWKP
jgi:hypothetical protein